MLNFNKSFTVYFYFFVCFSGLTYYTVFDGIFIRYSEIRVAYIIIAFALSFMFLAYLKKYKASSAFVSFIFLILYGIVLAFAHKYFQSGAELIRFILYLNIYLILFNTNIEVNFVKICQIISAIGVVMYVISYGQELNSSFRVTGNTASVMGYASLVYTSYLIMLILIRERTDRDKMKLSILPLLAVVASGSRSILFIQVMTFVIAYFHNNNINFQKYLFKIIKSTLILIILFTVTYFSTNIFYRFEILLSGSMLVDTSTSFRIMIVNTVIDNLNEFLITGIGLGSFPLWFEAKTGLADVAPHSEFIWLLVEFGIVGILVYSAFLYFAYKKSSRKNILVIIFVLLQVIPLHFANSFYFYQVGMLQFAFLGYLHRKKCTADYNLPDVVRIQKKVIS